VLAIVLLAAVAVALVVGSRPRLPAPFGLARPGLVAVDLGGDIYVMNADGSHRVQLTSGPAVDSRPTWSPDGTHLVFESELADLSSTLVVMGIDDRRSTTVADGIAELGGLSWAPDSRRIAFGSRTVGSQDSAHPRALHRAFVQSSGARTCQVHHREGRHRATRSNYATSGRRGRGASSHAERH
jgi:dipeptidyl aminopeptidase/acylaminoacyl peptidase